MELLPKILIFILGVCFSVFAGHCVVRFLNAKMRKYVGTEEDKSAKLTATLGGMERFIYTLLIFFGKDYYTYIAIFFGLKIAQRLITFSKIEDHKQLKDVGQRVNVYFICNIVSLAFGILGGVFIRYLWSYGIKI